MFSILSLVTHQILKRSNPRTAERRQFITLLGGGATTTQHAASQRPILDQVCSKVLAPKNSPRCVQATISVRI
jgi:hypothetical protein